MAKNKYGAIRTTVDGITFASKKEAARYQDLKLLERSGAIEDLRLQPRFPILIEGKKVCTVVLDFAYMDNRTEEAIFEDVKGRDNPLSKLKRKMVEAFYDFEVTVI